MAKKRTPEELARIKARKEFVQSKPDLDPAKARQQFFVQTRVQELEKSGVEVTKERRAALRQKFASGNVQRAGFYTPADLAKYTGGSTGGSTGGGSTPTVKQTGGYMDPTRGKDVVGFKPGQVQKSTSKGKIIKAPSAAAQKGWDAEYGVERSNSNWYERNVAKPLQRYGATNPVGVPGQAAKDVVVGAKNLVNETLGSMAATFTNPTINAVAGLFGKKPKLREAGVAEAAITTAGTILDISTLGGSKPVTTALTRSAQKVSQSLLRKNMVSAATVASNVARKSKAAIEAAENLRMFPKVKGLDNLTSPTTKAPSKTKVPGDIGGVKFVKSGANDVVEKVKPAKKAKPVKAAKPVKPAPTKETYVAPQMQGTPNAALQAQLQAQADNAIEVGLKNTQVVANIKTEVAKRKPSIKPDQIIFSDEVSIVKGRAKNNQPITDLRSVTPEHLSAMKNFRDPVKKQARRKTAQKNIENKIPIEAAPYTDKTPVPAGKQFEYPQSPWEARTQRQAQVRAGEAQVPKSLADVKSATPAATSKAKPQFRTIFADQKDFNDFMASGGEGLVKSQSLGVQDNFIRKNKEFIDSNKKTSAQRALAEKVNEAKRKAEVTAINEANGFVRTIVPKSQQALRQPVKKAAPVKKAPKKSAKKSGKK
jgi:hypothetical protein